MGGKKVWFGFIVRAWLFYNGTSPFCVVLWRGKKEKGKEKKKKSTKPWEEDGTTSEEEDCEEIGDEEDDESCDGGDESVAKEHATEEINKENNNAVLSKQKENSAPKDNGKQKENVASKDNNKEPIQEEAVCRCHENSTFVQEENAGNFNDGYYMSKVYCGVVEADVMDTGAETEDAQATAMATAIAKSARGCGKKLVHNRNYSPWVCSCLVRKEPYGVGYCHPCYTTAILAAADGATGERKTRASRRK